MDDQEVSDQYAPEAVESAVSERWDETDAYEAAKAAHADDPSFFFVDGPPYTTGQMHLGTAWNKTLKDTVIRRTRMEGHDVTDRPGYDMHGLPIETKVEQELGFETKRDIEEFGMEAFIEECREFAERNRQKMDEDFQSIGAWMDWDDPYRTVSPEYMEAAWWALARVHDRGLVEQGKRAISQCPRCETAIADNEVEYHEIESPSIYVKFPLREREGNLVVWTTTPWTVPANTFVAVSPDLTYQQVRAERDGETETLYLAEQCVEGALKEGRYDDYEVVDEFSGEELVGWEYEFPLAEEVPDYPDFEGAGQVYTADYVEADRTGLVHSAPGHGQEDFERGRELGLDVFSPVGGDGVYTDQAGKYAGTFVRDANDDIIADLDAKGLLLASGTHRHRYGQCWRCDTDIVFLATDQWFIRITDIKDELLTNIGTSEWHPEGARDGRFRNFVEEAPDWNISRQRYWGIPLPIWVPEGQENYDAADLLVVATREELAERVDQDIDPDSIDLHRPSVDDLTITEDGTRYERVPDVFDVWFDSSVASLGTIGYPGDEAAFEELWPADLIIEAHDQTRGWFWSQLGMGTAALGEAPYDEVLMHGFTTLGDGTKMSKSRGNIVTPQEAIEEVGRDPLRCYLLSHEQQGQDLAFEWAGLHETQSTLNILWNVFRFPLPYMNLDGYDPAEADLGDGELTVVDEWVLSRLQSVKAEMDEAWDDYRVDDALNALLDFVTADVSRFYVKAIRERMWEEEDSPSKRAAYATMSTLLDEVTRLLAPYAPYLTERMYQHLDGAATTVHQLSVPEVDETLRDEELERDMAVLRGVEEAAANARQRAGRKLRWPVTRVVVESDDAATRESVEHLRGLLADRVNAREIEVVESYGELVEVAEPEMSKLGPAFGGDAQRVMEAVEGAVRAELETGEGLSVAVDGETYELDDGMVTFHSQAPEGVVSAEFDGAAVDDGARQPGDGGGAVYVDTELTDDIESEGYARDVVRRVQEMRKDLDLEVDETIRVSVDVEDDRVAGFVEEHRAYVAEEVRASHLDTDEFDPDAPQFDLVEEWDVEGVSVTIGVARTPAGESEEGETEAADD
ncbi:isoleucine--tRNA ligase [Candidatus Halobonum tyrrellensis]|uniref:Isoleucine--tRNA ligase n=1 Tax=Candidatus Halobonum tyrrellensis G22 TaxID=1324957 RepID=V4HCU5_9EURY|nr:isoleucine--tRNA ligase [Candidatus Halobonum tyrrellensis]ESP88535.1 isoleucyl-tRNA ligase [Candidatus Halobonum tyrrellensis G22]